MAYEVEGQLLEVCDCNVLCPCWIGEDPDNGTCEAILAYHIEKGKIDQIDVSGRTLAIIAHLPGNVLEGHWKIAVFVDEKASQEQQDAILNVWTGKMGGPIADLAQLIGEVVAIEKAPIVFDVKEGKGTLKIGTVAEATMAAYKGATGQTTTLNDSLFTTIPGSPAWVAKADTYRRNTAKYGLVDVNLKNHNAIQGTFRFAA